MLQKHIDLFYTLASSCGVSGNSYEVASIFLNEAKRLGLQCNCDSLGSISAALFTKFHHMTPTKNNILISAHIDHTGYIVYEKPKTGVELSLYPVGVPLLEGKCDGIIKTHHGKLNGIIIDSQKDYEPSIFRLKNKDDLEKVNIGDIVYYKNNLLEKPKGKFTAPYMDNKASILSLLMVMERIATYSILDKSLFFVLSEFEEIGAYGIIAAVNKIKPLFAINLDVFPVHSSKELNSGVIINIGTIFNKTLIEFAKTQAIDNKIPFTLSVPSPEDESDSNYILPQNGGTPCCEIGVPCLNVHQPNEVVSKKSIQDTANLLFYMCTNLNNVKDLIPGGLYGM